MLNDRRLPLLLGALLLFFSLSACDSNGSDGDDDGVDAGGDASITISGNGVDESFGGNAFFATGTDDQGNQAFIIYLFTGEDFSQNESFAFIARESDRAGEGDYSFADLDQNDDLLQDEFVLGGFLRASGSQNAEPFNSEGGGTLTITESSDDRVEGTFDVNGTFVRIAGGQAQEVDVSITGSFEAPGGDFFTPPL